LVPQNHVFLRLIYPTSARVFSLLRVAVISNRQFFHFYQLIFSGTVYTGTSIQWHSLAGRKLACAGPSKNVLEQWLQRDDDQRIHCLELAVESQLLDGKAMKKTRPRRIIDYAGGMICWALVYSYLNLATSTLEFPLTLLGCLWVSCPVAFMHQVLGRGKEDGIYRQTSYLSAKDESLVVTPTKSECRRLAQFGRLRVTASKFPRDGIHVDVHG
jgi:hypothetical protein